MSQIELFKQTSVVPSSKSENKTDDSIESGVLKYQMMYLPEKARMQEAARVAQLEQRLCCLENLIGTSNDKLSKFSQVGLVISLTSMLLMYVLNRFFIYFPFHRI